MKKRFLRKCPTCSAQDKVIMRCPLCFKLTCKECSIELICMDCYIDSRMMLEVDNYFTDKYGFRT